MSLSADIFGFCNTRQQHTGKHTRQNNEQSRPENHAQDVLDEQSVDRAEEEFAEKPVRSYRKTATEMYKSSTDAEMLEEIIADERSEDEQVIIQLKNSQTNLICACGKVCKNKSGLTRHRNSCENALNKVRN